MFPNTGPGATKGSTFLLLPYMYGVTFVTLTSSKTSLKTTFFRIANKIMILKAKHKPRSFESPLWMGDQMLLEVVLEASRWHPSPWSFRWDDKLMS